MKICFLTTVMFNEGGVSRVLSALAAELSKYYSVTVSTLESPDKEDRNRYHLPDSIKVDFSKSFYKKGFFRRACRKINQRSGVLKKLNSDKLWDGVYVPEKLKRYWREYINSNHFDVVIAVQGYFSVILGSIAGELSCRTIGWQHNSYEAYFENKGRYHWNQDYLFKKYIPHLDHYVVLNEHDEEMIRQKMGIDALTIYNPRSFVSEQKAALINKRFIAAGGLRSAKGFDLLITSFEEFAKSNKDWTLDIFGEGPDRKSLQNMIKEKNLEDRVSLKGLTNDIGGEMLSSSALLLSSRWEGMPMVVLEALETGLPVVSYDITAITPLVTDGVEGLIVKQFDTSAFAEAMNRIASDYEERVRMGKNSYVKSGAFDVNNIVEKWKKIL